MEQWWNHRRFRCRDVCDSGFTSLPTLGEDDDMHDSITHHIAIGV
jgi:hypothetical protein